MKKSSGFTLIEILAVIVILAIVLAIGVPAISGIINNSYNTAYDIQLKLIEKAAKTLVGSGGKTLTEGTNKITVNELTAVKFITPIIDPRDKVTTCDAYVTVTKTGNNITYDPYMKCGSNYTTAGYISGIANANIHSSTIPDGYTGVYTIEDLNNMRNNLAGKYILMNDLDFNNDSSYANAANKPTYTTGAGWQPISTFTGAFDGNNYTIDHLYINRNGNDWVGLFGIVNTSNAIERIGLTNVNITGHSIVGSLIGRVIGSASGIVRNCYSTGTVTGGGSNPSYVGGLIGELTLATIDKCYSSATVSGVNYVGGLLGNPISGTVSNSFAAGTVTDTWTGAGRLFGYSPSSTLNNNYYNKESTLNQVGSGNSSGYGYPASILKSELFINYMAGWDIQNTWYTSFDDYPSLGGTLNNTNAVATTQISKIEHLFAIRNNLSGNYTLLNDLDFNADSSYAVPGNKTALTTGLGWEPIRSYTGFVYFTGSFNGNNHIIKNLYINRPTESHLGLFGMVNTANAIESVGLENVNITGDSYVGALVSDMATTSGIIRNAYSTGTVVGIGNTPTTGQNIGGLVGRLTNATIDKSYSTVNVTGHVYPGGLLGSGSSAFVTNSFSTGNVTDTGTGFYALLLGYQPGTITNCYYSNTAVASGTGALLTYGTSTSPANLQSLSLTGLNTWNTSTIWQVNAGAYPTLR